jgi:hypothetical protein
MACCTRFTPLGPDGEALGSLIISVITATTFIVQIFGPIGVKLAISRAGEIGMAKHHTYGWASEGRPEVLLPESEGCDDPEL